MISSGHRLDDVLDLTFPQIGWAAAGVVESQAERVGALLGRGDKPVAPSRPQRSPKQSASNKDADLLLRLHAAGIAVEDA